MWGGFTKSFPNVGKRLSGLPIQSRARQFKGEHDGRAPTRWPPAPHSAHDGRHDGRAASRTVRPPSLDETARATHQWLAQARDAERQTDTLRARDNRRPAPRANGRRAAQSRRTRTRRAEPSRARTRATSATSARAREGAMTTTSRLARGQLTPSGLLDVRLDFAFGPLLIVAPGLESCLCIGSPNALLRSP